MSGGHFNPAVRLPTRIGGLASREPRLGAFPGQRLRRRRGPRKRDVQPGRYQHLDADRASAAHLLSEIVATSGLLLLNFSLARTHRTTTAPAAVGAYIGAAYFFTSSTSFANPAITVGRMFSDTFAGIAPVSAPGFIVAQLVGLVVAVAAVRSLYPAVAPRDAATVIVPHEASA